MGACDRKEIEIFTDARETIYIYTGLTEVKSPMSKKFLRYMGKIRMEV